MANSSGNLDPWGVDQSLSVGIGDSAQDARYTIGSLSHPSAGGGYGFGDGVFPSFTTGSVPGDFLVSPTSPTASMAAVIAPGSAQIARTNIGPYIGASITQQTVTFAAANATNPRYDLVLLRTNDPGVDSSPTQSWYPVVLTGTPSATPAAPTNLIQDNDLLLARITIRANTNQVLGTDVVDYRQYAAARGGIFLAAAGDTRPGAFPGQYRDNQATAGIERWNGSSWIPVATGAGWNVFTPTLYYGGDGYHVVPGTVPANLGTGAVSTGRWIVTGKVMHLNYSFQWGTRPYNMGTGNISTTLPPGWTHTPNGGTSLLNTFLGVNGELPNGWNPVFPGTCLLFPATNILWPMFEPPIASATINNNVTLFSQGVGYYTAATTQGTPSTGCPFIPGGFPQGGSLTIDGTFEVV